MINRQEDTDRSNTQAFPDQHGVPDRSKRGQGRETKRQSEKDRKRQVNQQANDVESTIADLNIKDD